jgi:hypothetical protein
LTISNVINTQGKKRLLPGSDTASLWPGRHYSETAPSTWGEV